MRSRWIGISMILLVIAFTTAMAQDKKDAGKKKDGTVEVKKDTAAAKVKTMRVAVKDRIAAIQREQTALVDRYQAAMREEFQRLEGMKQQLQQMTQDSIDVRVQ